MALTQTLSQTASQTRSQTGGRSTAAGLFADAYSPEYHYSLQKVADASTTIARVRRSGDQLEADFTADQIAGTSGALAHNLSTYSEELGQWAAPKRSTLSENATTDPWGGDVADSLSEDGTAASTHYIQHAGISVTSGLVYTMSAYIKASNRNWVRLGFIGAGNGAHDFDVTASAGAVGSAGTNSAGGVIEDVLGDGTWYRCSFQFTPTSTASSIPRISILEADNDQTFDGLSQESLHIIGLQTELGSSVGNYVATTDTAQTDYQNDMAGWVGSENLFTYSEQFDNAAWTKDANVTLTANATTDPDGGDTADKLEATIAGVANVSRSHTLTASTAYTVEVKVKDGTGAGWIAIQTSNFDPSANGITYFQLTGAGVLGTDDGNHSNEAITLADSYYRCSLSFLLDTDNIGTITIHAAEGQGDLALDTAGDHVFLSQAALYPGTTLLPYARSVATAAGDGYLVTSTNQGTAGEEDLTQATAASQPQIVTAGVLDVDGSSLANMVFDGSDDNMATGAFCGALTQPNTILLVAQFDNPDTSTYIAYDGIVGTSEQSLLTASGAWQIDSGTLVTTGDTDDAVQHLFTTLFNNTASGVWLDGTSILSGATSGAETMTGLTLGADNAGASDWDGKISEIIIFDSDKTSSRTAMEAEIQARYPSLP